MKVPKVNYYGTGKRKTSIAKVWLFEGTGNILINDMPVLEYIKRDVLKDYILRPLEALSALNKYNVVIKTLGGGLTGQAGACQLGIARALLAMNESLRAELKKFGFLTRDSRIKERKKYGCKRARKGFQYRKR
jgi:small subunit ribosomal protein S9